MSAIIYSVDGPILHATFVAVPSESEFDHFLEYLGANLTRAVNGGPRVATIIHTTRAASEAPRSLRLKQAEWLRQHEQNLRTFSCGTAFVFESFVVRFVLSSILLIHGIPTPYTVCVSVDEAQSWCREQLLQEAMGSAA